MASNSVASAPAAKESLIKIDFRANRNVPTIASVTPHENWSGIGLVFATDLTAVGSVVTE